MRNHFFTRPHAERGRLRHISSSRSAIPRSVFNYLIPHREHSSGLHSHSIPVFSPNANTAFLTHSGHGHNGTPVSIPFKSLQIVPPHLAGNPIRSPWNIVVFLCLLSDPPQLQLHRSMPHRYSPCIPCLLQILLSISSVLRNSPEACPQMLLIRPVCSCTVLLLLILPRIRHVLSIVIIILLCIFSYIMFSTQPHPNKPFLVLPEATINFHG